MAAVPRMSSLLALRPAQPAPGRRPADDHKTTALARMAEATGLPVTRLMADFAALSLGAGRVSLSDYETLRLYDDAFWGPSDRREVVGARRGRELVLRANFRHESFGLASDRIAASLYLAAHGLPTIPILAIFRPGLATPGRDLLKTRDELRQFLARHAGRPLVARPAEGTGAHILFRDPADRDAEIDRLVDGACDAPGAGWLFQPLMTSHRACPAQMSGGLAPVRLVTLCGERGPRLFRAFWPLDCREPLVASLELKSGQAMALAPAGEPERAQPLRAGDLVVPDWAEIKATAAEGARLFAHLGLIAWDIAPTPEGPVILGLDPLPDLSRLQMIDRRGVYCPELRAFLQERRALARDWRDLEASLD
jgi:hypothetical protein